jgi:hypothetical protein
MEEKKTKTLPEEIFKKKTPKEDSGRKTNSEFYFYLFLGEREQKQEEREKRKERKKR